MKPSAGAKPDKLFRDAVMIAVKRIHTDDSGAKAPKINAIASKLVERAVAGNEQAAMMIRDSLDGKPAQAISIGGDAEMGPVSITWAEK